MSKQQCEHVDAFGRCQNTSPRRFCEVHSEERVQGNQRRPLPKPKAKIQVEISDDLLQQVNMVRELDHRTFRDLMESWIVAGITAWRVARYGEKDDR